MVLDMGNVNLCNISHRRNSFFEGEKIDTTRTLCLTMKRQKESAPQLIPTIRPSKPVVPHHLLDGRHDSACRGHWTVVQQGQ